MSLFDRWAATLDQLRAQGRFRQFALPTGIDFTSNDYLGYTALTPATPVNLSRTGAASRLLRGHHAIWEEVERSLAHWHGVEAVLMMTSGYTANEGLISTLIEPGDWVASDELNHACIVDGLRLARCRRFVFRHNDLSHLEDCLRAEVVRKEPGRERFVITEGLFSMDGDRAPLPEIADLCERYGAHLVVDEAHSTGCFGANGTGCIEASGVRHRVLASVHTGGKALGVPGAYIAGSRLLKDYLVNRCRHLIYTTALPPAVGAWWTAAIDRAANDAVGRNRLRANTERLRTDLAALGIEALGSEYIVPILVGDDHRAVATAARVREEGFDVRAIRPPSVPPGTARLRISVHADHKPIDLTQLAAAVVDALHNV